MKRDIFSLLQVANLSWWRHLISKGYERTCKNSEDNTVGPLLLSSLTTMKDRADGKRPAGAAGSLTPIAAKIDSEFLPTALSSVGVLGPESPP